MSTQSNWKKWVAIVGLVGTLFAIFGSVLGAGINAVNDRATIVGRLDKAETGLSQHQAANTEAMSSFTRRLDLNDARWQAMETNISRLREDVAVMKAILERVERDRTLSHLPAKNSLDGPTQ